MDQGARKVVRFTGVGHVGLGAKDPGTLAAFYRDVMGMTVVGGSDGDDQFGVTAFVSGRPNDENHEIAIFADPSYKHTAFRVATLDELREFYRQIVDLGLPIKMQLNHGCSLAFYFDDPEGNTIEIYWATNIHNWQPYGDPIDLADSPETLLADVARVARETKTVPAPNT